VCSLPIRPRPPARQQAHLVNRLEPLSAAQPDHKERLRGSNRHLAGVLRRRRQSVTYAVYIAPYGLCSVTTATACGSDSDCPSGETCSGSLACSNVDDKAVYTVDQLSYPALYVMTSQD